jgi:cation-transporting ATPase F
MLLTDDNFASIKAAKEEGRSVPQPVKGNRPHAIGTQGEPMTILIIALLACDLPILALQVLWLSRINSITKTVPVSFEPKVDDTMARPPRDPG